MSEQKEQGLKPCPFCGGKALAWTYRCVAMACCDDSDCPGREIKCPFEVWNTRPLEAQAAEIAELRAWKNASYTDENGTVWTRPEPWAYSQAAKAIDKHRARALAAEKALATAREDALEEAAEVASLTKLEADDDEQAGDDEWLSRTSANHRSDTIAASIRALKTKEHSHG